MTTTPDSYPSLAELRVAVKVMEIVTNHGNWALHLQSHETEIGQRVFQWCCEPGNDVPAMLEKTRRQIEILEGR